MQYIPSSASLRTSGTDTKIALTFTISSVSSIISCLLFWTFEMAMYRLYIGSMLATMDVKLGLLSTPGAGWITSAPMMMAGFWGSERMGTERASGTALTPPSFTLTLKHNQRQPREKCGEYELEHDICIVLRLRTEALLGLETLRRNTHLAIREAERQIVNK